MRDLVERINVLGRPTVFVTDGADVLVASVTDGDVRRALLSGHRLESAASVALNQDYLFLRDDDELLSGAARSAAENRCLSELPVVDAEGRLLAVESLKSARRNPPRANTVVIMAGGKGLRLRPLTDNTPKPMLSMGGRPILEHLVSALRKEGFKRVVLAVNYLSEQIESYFGDGSLHDVAIDYIRETNPLGTAGALSLMETPGELPVVVMNADLVLAFSVAKMVDYHVEKGATITVGAKVVETTSPYGVLVTQGTDVLDVLEKPTRSELVNAGVYVVNPDVISGLHAAEARDMPDLITEYANSARVVAFPIYEHWADVGRLEDLRAVQDQRDFGES